MSTQKKASINPSVPNALFLYPLKTSENRTVYRFTRFILDYVDRMFNICLFCFQLKPFENYSSIC